MRIKTIRTSLCVLVTLAMALTLGACKKEVAVAEDRTPTETVEIFMNAFKTQDWETMSKVYSGDTEEFSSSYGTAEGEEAGDTLREEFLSKMYEFDYQTGKEEIAEDGKTATVEINTTTYDMVEVFNNFYQEYMSQALEQYSGKSEQMKDEDLEKMATGILEEELSKAKKDYKGEATLPLTQTNDGWKVDELSEDDPEFLNAISGGMLDVASDIVNAKEGAGQ